MRIGGYQRTSLVDFPGRVAAVVFTQGCNFRCPWCHNRQLVEPARFEAALCQEVILRHLGSRIGKLSGVVISGGEPTLQPDLIDFMSAVRRMDFAVKLDTNGSAPQVVADLLARGLVDFIAMDLKAPWRRYEQACGVAVDTTSIRETIRIVQRSGVPHHLRTTDWAGFTEEEWREIEIAAEGSLVVRQSCLTR